MERNCSVHKRAQKNHQKLLPLHARKITRAGKFVIWSLQVHLPKNSWQTKNFIVILKWIADKFPGSNKHDNGFFVGWWWWCLDKLSSKFIIYFSLHHVCANKWKFTLILKKIQLKNSKNKTRRLAFCNKKNVDTASVTQTVTHSKVQNQKSFIDILIKFYFFTF